MLDERGSQFSEQDLSWVLDNIFSLPELKRLFVERPELVSTLPPATPELVKRAASQLASNGTLDPSLEDAIEDWLDLRTAPLRRADRHFWRAVIESLRQMHARGELMTEGALV